MESAEYQYFSDAPDKRELEVQKGTAVRLVQLKRKMQQSETADVLGC